MQAIMLLPLPVSHRKFANNVGFRLGFRAENLDQFLLNLADRFLGMSWHIKFARKPVLDSITGRRGVHFGLLCIVENRKS
jgi:hypothetical protein